MRIKFGHMIYDDEDNFAWRYICEDRDDQNQPIFNIQYFTKEEIIKEQKIRKSYKRELCGIYTAISSFITEGVCVYLNETEYMIIGKHTDEDYYKFIGKGSLK